MTEKVKNWQKIKAEPERLTKFLGREKVIRRLRQFFSERGFHEVETPLLVPNPGTEPYLEVFETKLLLQNEAPKAAFLVTSPELQMKKLLAAGLGNIFQITKSFRNGEGRSPTHNSEFTILEYYRQDATYFKLMDDMDQLLPYLLGEKLTYQGKIYDLSQGCERMMVKEAFAQYAQVTEKELLDRDLLCAVAVKKGYQVTAETTWEEVYNQIFLNEIEPRLGQVRPTIVYNYPRAQAALAKLCEDDPNYAQRLEIYLAGLELGNGFGELTDASEQESRCQADLAERARLGKTPYDYDHDFIAALGEINFPAAGIAIGVDRLIMLATNAGDITEVTFFPTTELF